MTTPFALLYRKSVPIKYTAVPDTAFEKSELDRLCCKVFLYHKSHLEGDGMVKFT